MYQNKYVPPRTIVANNFSFKPPSLPMRLSGLAKQVVLFCSMASMKVVWINKEWIALMFVVYCPAHSLFRQRGWRRWCPKIPVETVSWWLKPLYTFCTGHIFEKSSLWNWISLTWGSLERSFHTGQQSESEIHLSKFVILLNFWKWLCNARTHFLLWIWEVELSFTPSRIPYGIFSARISVHFNSQTMKLISLLFKLT